MTRLKYSLRAFIRSLQMSRADLFAFVEGWSDRYFYDRIVELSCRGTDLVQQVRTAQEIPGDAGGKASLISFFSFLEQHGLLIHTFKGKKSAAVFFLDKDVDDILRIAKVSAHAIYTEHYHHENYLILETDVTSVAAIAGSLDVESIRAVVGEQPQWMRLVSESWIDWVTLCVTAQLANSRCGCTYSLSSQINPTPYSPVDGAAVTAFRTEIHRGCGMTGAEFAEIETSARAHVDGLYRRGQQNRIFKGQWYAIFLADDIRRAAGGRPYNVSGIEARILSVALAQLDFERPWVGYFVARLQPVLQNLQG